MNVTCRYIATGDSIPPPLSLPPEECNAIDIEGSLKGDERGRERDGARIIIWDASSLSAVASIQISSSTATGISYIQLQQNRVEYNTI